MNIFIKKVETFHFFHFHVKRRVKTALFWGFFPPKRKVTSCLSCMSFAQLKITFFESLCTSHSQKSASKKKDFHIKKCPKFVDPVFNNFYYQTRQDCIFSLKYGSWREDSEVLRKIAMCASPWGHAEHRRKKPSNGCGGSKKDRIQIFFAC